uniref:Uncharacterized protein n=1 Tax=Rhizophora mucronata TaxID=61149 RepID=A0A2P2QNA9_RHIMU
MRQKLAKRERLQPPLNIYHTTIWIS